MKTLLKETADWLFWIVAAPLFLLYCVARLLLGKDKAFPGYSQIVSLIPGLVGVYFRRGFYSWVLPACGRDSWIGFGTIFSYANATVGHRSYIGVFCCLGDVDLGDDVLVGSHVSIANGSRQHGSERIDIPMREQPGEWPKVTIGCDTWIGDRAVVLVNVGSHCIIGAGSVVTKPLPDYAVAVGNPARITRFRNDSVAVTESDGPASIVEERSSR